MRWEEMKNKEIINVTTGERLGLLGDCDLEINIHTGKINKLLVPEIRGYLSFLSEQKVYSLSWNKIKKIGSDMVIVEN